MKNNKLMWIVSLIPLFLTGMVIRFLPDQMPAHYDFAGNVDRWGSKYEYFIFPVTILILSLMWQCMIHYFHKKAVKSDDEKVKVEAEANARFLRIVAVVMAIVFGIEHVVMTYSSYIEAVNNLTSSAIDVFMVINILWGIAMIVLGNYLPRVKRNGVVGIRTKKTVNDDNVWKKANRFGGISLMVSGVLIVIETLLVGGMLSTGLMVGILLAMAVVNLVYVARL